MKKENKGKGTKILFYEKGVGFLGCDSMQYVVGADMSYQDSNKVKAEEGEASEVLESATTTRKSMVIENPRYYLSLTQAFTELYNQNLKAGLLAYKHATSLEEFVSRIERIGKAWGKYINSAQFNNLIGLVKEDK